MSDPARLILGPMRTPASTRWFVAQFLAVAVTLGWAWFRYPDGRLWLGATLVFAAVFVVLVVSRTRPELSTGTASAALVQSYALRAPHRVPLTDRAEVRLVRRADAVALVARAAGGPTARAVLLDVSQGRGSCRSAEELRTIAEALSSSCVAGGTTVARVLRAQAQYLSDGGDLTASPLAVYRGGGPRAKQTPQ